MAKSFCATNNRLENKAPEGRSPLPTFLRCYSCLLAGRQTLHQLGKRAAFGNLAAWRELVYDVGEQGGHHRSELTWVNTRLGGNLLESTAVQDTLQLFLGNGQVLTRSNPAAHDAPETFLLKLLLQSG